MSSVPLPRTPGIYQITCIPTGKIYIGSAKNLRDRWRRHFNSANKGDHDNPHLQKAWAKYGADAFTFAILELCPLDDLVKREQHYLDTLQPHNRSVGFNIAPHAYSALGMKHSTETLTKLRGRKVSEATKEKLRAYRNTDEYRERMAAAGRGRKHTPESIAKMRAAKVGKKMSAETIAKFRARKPTEATRAKLSASRKGKTQSEETKAKRRQYRHTDEARAKIAQAKIGKPRSKETIAKTLNTKRLKKLAAQYPNALTSDEM